MILKKVLCVVALSMMASCFMMEPEFFQDVDEHGNVIRNTYVVYANDHGWAQVTIPNYIEGAHIEFDAWRALHGVDGEDYQYLLITDVHVWPDGTLGAQTYPGAKVLFVVEAGSQYE